MIRALAVVFFVLIVPAAALGQSGIVYTKHNLSSWGPGEIRALSEDRICIFCHTPHNATPQTPLWNRDIVEGINYDLYESSTFNVTLDQPSGPSRLCLSCHDGTIGLGAVLSVSSGIQMTRELTGRPSLLGTDLRNDHPFSFSYFDALTQNNELRPQPPTDISTYNGGVIHCSTCHDPHDDTYGMFLAVDNRYSGLCTKCHFIPAWGLSTHAISTVSWNNINPNPWPLNERLTNPVHHRTTVAENGCENCHTSHNAGGPQRLMNFLEEEDNCTYACHNGNTDSSNIAAELQKVSTHPMDMATIGDFSGNAHDPIESATSLTGHVECVDCHDPHGVNGNIAQAPLVNGRLAGVSGVSEFGTTVNKAQFEYEICYKCHGDTSNDTAFINRYKAGLNKRQVFANGSLSMNPSFHPVANPGRNTNVPSLVNSGFNVGSRIYCMDCHDSNSSARIGGAGPSGPHGSIYTPILRAQYIFTSGTTESYSAYELCYRCHDRDNILSDASFKKKNATGTGGHSGHLSYGGGTPCSVCHDPHGVYDPNYQSDPSGDHTHLINFDSAIVTPVSGTYPVFTDNGEFAGTCTLICHGVAHNAYSYP